MNQFIFTTFIPAVANLGLGVYVWSRNPEARENRLLALACLGLSIFSFRAFEVYTRPVEFAEIIFPVLTFGPLYAGAFLSDFLLTIARRPLLPRRWLQNLVIYVPVTLFSLGEIFTDWFFSGIEITETGQFIPISGPLSYLPNSFLAVLLLLALFQAFRSLLTTDNPQQRKQLNWSVSGIGISMLATLLVLFFPIRTFTATTEFMIVHVTFSTTLIAATMVYAIARHGMAPSIEQLRREKAEAAAREAELQRQILDAQIREERRRQEELERELQTAHDLQMGLMPGESPHLEGFDLAGRCLPATHVGGDYFQFFARDDRLTIGVADVTGHAMQAAIPVVMFSGILESQMELDSPVDELFGRLNRSLCRILDSRTFVCFSLGQLDLDSRTIHLANAGCPYPYHFDAATGQVVELQIDAYPLGVRSESTYWTVALPLKPGDRIVFCSDGILEAQDSADRMFGYERTAELIRSGCAEDLSARRLLEHIFDAVLTFTGETEATDDMTCVVLGVDRAS